MKRYALPFLFAGLLHAQIHNPPQPGSGTQVLFNSSPPWTQNLGTGADGACAPSTGNYSGDRWCTTFSVPFGTTLTVNSANGLVVHATGACTIAGTITAAGQYSGGSAPIGGGASGGSGGGAAGGTAGANVTLTGSYAYLVGGTAGASSGGAGGNAAVLNNLLYRASDMSGGGTDGLFWGGGKGQQGGSSGGLGGNGGAGITLICGSIIGTDGSHVGILDVSGVNGVPAAANSTGSGSGGGGGIATMSSQAAVATWPTVYAAPGAPAGAGTTTSIVPEALGVGGLCTVEPVMTLGVTAGALSGVCTVITAGTCTATGSATPAGWTYSVVGGGGTLGTGTVVPVWSSGAISTCTATAGNSSGYTAATFTTSGTAGTSTPGRYVEWAAGVQVH